MINTSSIQADNPSPQLLPYAMTKAGIQNFTGGLAQMLGKKGIRANCVAPGPIWTPLIPATMPEEKVKNFGKDVALGRAGQPAELAPVSSCCSRRTTPATWPGRRSRSPAASR